MARSFGKKDKGGNQAGARPVPTIEGTATEVTPEPEASAKPETSSGPEASAEPEANSEPKVTAEAEAAKDDRSPKTAAPGSSLADRGSGDVKAEDDETELPAPPEDATDAKDDGDDDHETPERDEPPVAEPAIAAEAPPRGSGGRGILGGLAAGLLGGLIGAGALAFAWGYLPMTKTAQAPDLAPLEGRIATLENAPKPESGEALAGRVAALETSMKAMASAAKDGGSVGDAAAVSQQIAAAEKRLDGKLDTALAELQSRQCRGARGLAKRGRRPRGQAQGAGQRRAEFGRGGAPRAGDRRHR